MLFHNKPIVQHTIEKLITLKEENFIQEIVLSTDYEGIERILKGEIFTDSEILNHIYIEQRRDELLNDDTPMGDVVHSFVKNYKKQLDNILMVYPTGLLVDPKNIKKAIKILKNCPEIEAVNPVVPGPNPEHALFFKDEDSVTWEDRKDEKCNSKRGQRFYPSGNWNIARKIPFLNNPRFHGLKHKAIIVNPTTCVDIDYPEDLEILEAFYQYQMKKSLKNY